MTTMIIHQARLSILMDKFPQLWANYKKEFGTFFDAAGKMNTTGYKMYDKLKQKRHERINYKK